MVFLNKPMHSVLHLLLQQREHEQNLQTKPMRTIAILAVIFAARRML